MATELWEPVAMRRDELPKPHLESVFYGSGDRREVAVLDELLELPQARCGNLYDTRTLLCRLAEEAPDRLGAVRQVPVGPKPLELPLLVSGQPNPKEPTRRKAARIRHPFNEN